MWTNAVHLPTTASSCAKIWLVPSCAFVQRATAKLIWQTIVWTLMNASMGIYAVTVGVTTCKAAIDAIAIKDLKQVRMERDALVSFLIWHILIIIIIFFFFEFVDKRQGMCYRQLVNGRCKAPHNELKLSTMADCCCSMGEAWGPQCELCPSRYTPQYQELCLDSGFLVDGKGALYFIWFDHNLTIRKFSDVNECETIPDLCRNGQCINTLGSYRCICNKGYRPDPSGLYCLGKFFYCISLWKID